MHPTGGESVGVRVVNGVAAKRRRRPGRREELENAGGAGARVTGVAVVAAFAIGLTPELGAMAINEAGEPDGRSGFRVPAERGLEGAGPAEVAAGDAMPLGGGLSLDGRVDFYRRRRRDRRLLGRRRGFASEGESDYNYNGGGEQVERLPGAAHISPLLEPRAIGVKPDGRTAFDVYTYDG